MIVSCPSCNVRYRHETEAGSTVRARCSGCHATFDMGPARRAYRLMPRLALAGASGRGAVAFELPYHPGALELPQQPAAAAMAAMEAAPAQTAENRESRGLSIWAVGLALLAAGVATASGYYLSLLEVTDTMTGTAAGAGAGAALAWAVIRWNTRAR